MHVFIVDSVRIDQCKITERSYLKRKTGNGSLHDKSNENISFINEDGLAVNAAQRVATRSRL